MSDDAADAAARTDARVGAIWAQDRHGLIGADGGMLWRVPADFRHFKAATLGGIVMMGRTTWESIGTALPGRVGIVLTRSPSWSADGAAVAGSLREAMARARGGLAQLGADPREDAYRGGPRLWVIGGGRIYEQALAADAVDELVVTTIDLDVSQRAGAGAVRAPRIDPRRWTACRARSDDPRIWRPVSGDAAWRVDHWVRARPAQAAPDAQE